MALFGPTLLLTSSRGSDGCLTPKMVFGVSYRDFTGKGSRCSDDLRGDDKENP